MSDDKDEAIENPDPHFEPLVHLAPVHTKTLEEDEDEMLKLRAKLFRYDCQSEPREWKERGTGDIKILFQKHLGTCRILMRRDKTLKICANHYVLPQLELKPNCGSDRAWVWSTPADFADEEPKAELLAIRFANADNAQLFKEAFEKAKQIMTKRLKNAEKGDVAKKDAENDLNKENNGTAEDNENNITVEEKDSNAPVKDGQKEIVEKLEKLAVKDIASKDSGEAKCDSASSKDD